MGFDGSAKSKLLHATDTLGEELIFIKSSLDTYCVIGPNASRIPSGDREERASQDHAGPTSSLSVTSGSERAVERAVAPSWRCPAGRT